MGGPQCALVDPQHPVLVLQIALEDLGVERALIVDTLLLVLSQCLVRSAVGGRLPVYELLRLDEILQDRPRLCFLHGLGDIITC